MQKFFTHLTPHDLAAWLHKQSTSDYLTPAQQQKIFSDYCNAPYDCAAKRLITVGGKKRFVVALSDASAAKNWLVARSLAKASEPFLSPHLYSYRVGRSWVQGVQQAAAYQRFWRQQQPPQQRYMYVLRCDVKEYTDSIPVSAAAPVWGMIRKHLTQHWQRPLSAAEEECIVAAIRPTYHHDDHYYTPCYGVPTGTTVAPVLYNIYLAELDNQLATLPDCFYGRFGDDIIFMHHDAAVVKQAQRLIITYLTSVGLTLNHRKTQQLCLTANGHHSPVASYKPTQSITWLGCALTAAGTVAIPNTVIRHSLRMLRQRLRQALHLQNTQQQTEKITMTCQLTAAWLLSKHPLSQRTLQSYLAICTDRPQLRWLDREIAQSLATALTGVVGSKAFRYVTWRALRAAGLPSLVRWRNQREGFKPAPDNLENLTATRE